MTGSTTERTNDQWLSALNGPGQSRALADLRGVLVRGLSATLKSRPEGVSEAAIEDFAQERPLSRLANVDDTFDEVVYVTAVWELPGSSNVCFYGGPGDPRTPQLP